MAKIRIMLADDHTLFRQGIRTLISIRSVDHSRAPFSRHILEDLRRRIRCVTGKLG